MYPEYIQYEDWIVQYLSQILEKKYWLKPSCIILLGMLNPSQNVNEDKDTFFFNRKKATFLKISPILRLLLSS